MYVTIFGISMNFSNFKSQFERQKELFQPHKVIPAAKGRNID